MSCLSSAVNRVCPCRRRPAPPYVLAAHLHPRASPAPPGLLLVRLHRPTDRPGPARPGQPPLENSHVRPPGSDVINVAPFLSLHSRLPPRSLLFLSCLISCPPPHHHTHTHTTLTTHKYMHTLCHVRWPSSAAAAETSAFTPSPRPFLTVPAAGSVHPFLFCHPHPPSLLPPPQVHIMNRPGSPCSIFHGRASAALSSYKPSQGFITTHLMQIRHIWVDLSEASQRPPPPPHHLPRKFCLCLKPGAKKLWVESCSFSSQPFLVHNNLKMQFITDGEMWFSTLCRGSSPPPRRPPTQILFHHGRRGNDITLADLRGCCQRSALYIHESSSTELTGPAWLFSSLL